MQGIVTLVGLGLFLIALAAGYFSLGALATENDTGALVGLTVTFLSAAALRRLCSEPGSVV